MGGGACWFGSYSARVVRRGSVVAALLVTLAAAPPASAARPQVTLITDSVAGALLWDQAAARVFSDGINVDLELRSCRRLVAVSCAAAGETAPPSALELIRLRGHSIGKNVLIAVGYNDDPTSYG